MSLIEGVGDEVVQFVGVLVVFAVAAVAWWSTNARPDRYRTVLVMRSRPHHPVTVSIRTRPDTTITNSQNSIPALMDTVDGAPVSEPSEPSRQSRVIPLQEMDSIIDADMAMLDNNRLHFYRRMDSPSPENTIVSSDVEENEPQENVEPASSAQIREMDSIVNAMEADVTTGCDFFTRNQGCNSTNVASSTETSNPKIENEKTENISAASDNITNVNAESLDTHTASDVSVQGEKRILIKLKYLNDTLKEVDGSLDEQLKDFKWRHFSAELTSECRVRLIFNGRVLIDDAATLRACGLHHRAVVHCLVHPNRAAGQQRSATPEEDNMNTAEIISEATPVAERTWDLENILMTLVSVALTVVWFFRCEYSNMFTASASVALFGLTLFYSVAIFGLYLSDTFHFDRRPERPIPAN